MSEPMSSGEIEDVLSSIRRLVSEDLRPVTAQPKPVALPNPGKLLLTPALRVVSNTPPMIPKTPVLRLETPVVADPVAAQDWLPEAAGIEEDVIWGPVEEPDVEGWEQGVPADMTRVVSEIAAAVSESDEEWEPEGDAPMASLSWQAPEWVEEAELVEDASSAKALADAAEEAAVAEIMAKAAGDSPRSDGAQEEEPFAEDEGGYFDEAVLRDLVRDLIREELSGTLGERITRNVRKLVRAEINRAMTARNFD